MKSVLFVIALVSGIAQAQVVKPVPTYKYINENVIVAKCLKCHSDARSMAGISLEGYDNLMKYTIAGSPAESLFYEVLTEDAITRMPLGGALDKAQIDNIASWIQAGATKE